MGLQEVTSYYISILSRERLSIQRWTRVLIVEDGER
jgi:hypothetical protein